MHANNPGQRRSEELKVAHHGNRSALFILVSDSHRPVDLRAEFAAEVLERLWQGRDVRWPTVGGLEQGFDKAIANRPGREHHVPRLDVGVGRRMRRQSEGLLHQYSRHRLLRQKHPRRMAHSDRFLKVEHGSKYTGIARTDFNKELVLY